MHVDVFAGMQPKSYSFVLLSWHYQEVRPPPLEFLSADESDNSSTTLLAAAGTTDPWKHAVQRAVELQLITAAIEPLAVFLCSKMHKFTDKLKVWLIEDAGTVCRRQQY